MYGQKKNIWWIAIGVALVSATCLGADLVINEVAWSGTAASSSDEWIELHNPTSETVDLTGWVVSFGETTIHLGAEEGATRAVRRAAVGPGGYFVLERTDDDTVSDVEGDVLYVGALPNDGISIELRDAQGTIVDRVEVGDAGWPAGTAADGVPPYASMERVDPNRGADWVSNDGVIRNGVDAADAPLNGTPGRENSAYVTARHAPRVGVVAPAEEGAVVAGTVVIEWTATDPDGTAEALRVSIEISLDGGATWDVIVANLANGGSFAWDTTLHPDGDQVRLRVVAEDATGYRGAAATPTVTIRNGEG